MINILDIVWAVVSVSTGFLRNSPDYESPLETQLLMGSLVQVEDSLSYWRKVSATEPEYTGWINDLQLCVLNPEELEQYQNAPKYIFTGKTGYAYLTCSEQSQVLCDLVMGDVVRKGLIESGPWSQIILADGKTAWTLSKDIKDLEEWKNKTKPDGESIAKMAMQFVGVPYMWGGNSVKAFDCSGLSWTAYHMNGISLPRNASQQVKLGLELPLDDMASWQEGDLVFFGTPADEDRPLRASHVAIYIGEGRIVHASQIVRISSLVPEDKDFYDRTPIAVRRILGQL